MHSSAVDSSHSELQRHIHLEATVGKCTPEYSVSMTALTASLLAAPRMNALKKDESAEQAPLKDHQKVHMHVNNMFCDSPSAPVTVVHKTLTPIDSASCPFDWSSTRKHYYAML